MRTFVVITKVDMCQEHTTARVVEQVKQLLSPHKKIPTLVDDDAGVVVAAQNFSDKYMHYIHTLCACVYISLLGLSQYSRSPV